MIIDTISLSKIILQLPDADVYNYNTYLYLVNNEIEDIQEIVFKRCNCTDGTKRWVLDINQ